MNQAPGADRAGQPLPGDRPHRRLVRALIVLIGVITLVALISTWIERQVFDTDAWGDTSEKMLQDPAIQSALADYAVSELYDNVDVDAELKKVLPGDTKSLSGVVAGGLRQVATQGAERAFNDPRVQDLWRQANVEAHDTLIAVIEDRSDVVSTRNGEVELKLRPLIIKVANQLGLGGTVADKIPEDVGNVQVLKSDELGTAQKIAKLIHGLALVTSLLALALIALAVYLSRGYRWLTIIGIGSTLIVVAILTMILRAIGGNVIVNQLADPSVKPAAEAGWSIGTSLLKSIAWDVFFWGVAMIVAAWLVSPAASADAARRLLAWPARRFPEAFAALFALVALIWLLLGITSLREFLLRLGIIIIVGAAGLIFQRRLVREYPDAAVDMSGVSGGLTEVAGGLTDISDRVRAKTAEMWSQRPRGREEGEVEDEADRHLDRLERLASLHERGVLSDEEFAAEKARLRGSE